MSGWGGWWVNRFHLKAYHAKLSTQPGAQPLCVRSRFESQFRSRERSWLGFSRAARWGRCTRAGTCQNPREHGPGAAENARQQVRLSHRSSARLCLKETLGGRAAPAARPMGLEGGRGLVQGRLVGLGLRVVPVSKPLDLGLRELTTPEKRWLDCPCALSAPQRRRRHGRRYQ